jgi:hypothetical protein
MESVGKSDRIVVRESRSGLGRWLRRQAAGDRLVGSSSSSDGDRAIWALCNRMLTTHATATCWDDGSEGGGQGRVGGEDGLAELKLRLGWDRSGWDEKAQDDAAAAK